MDEEGLQDLQDRIDKHTEAMNNRLDWIPSLEYQAWHWEGKLVLVSNTSDLKGWAEAREGLAESRKQLKKAHKNIKSHRKRINRLILMQDAIIGGFIYTPF